MGWVDNVTPQPLYPRERDPVPILQEAGWAPEPVWTGAENLAFTGIRSPVHPARSESLYRLSYPGPLLVIQFTIKMFHIGFIQVLVLQALKSQDVPGQHDSSINIQTVYTATTQTDFIRTVAT